MIGLSVALVCQAQTSTGGGAANSTASSAPVDPQTVVIKVGDLQITRAQFETYIADLEAQQGPADLSRKQLGDSYASILMLSQMAVANHLDTSPMVIRQLAIDRNQILSNAEFARLKAETKPTAQEISDYYNAHLDDYDIIELRRVFIWKKGPGHDKGLSEQDARALATAIRSAYDAGSDPNKLVKDPESVVIDPAPLKFQREEMPASMAKAAFSMQKKGDWVELADYPDALVMLQLVSRSRIALSAASPQIEKKLQNQKLREDLEALKKKNGVWMDEQYFVSHTPVAAPSGEPEASGKQISTERGER